MVRSDQPDGAGPAPRHGWLNHGDPTGRVLTVAHMRKVGTGRGNAERSWRPTSASSRRGAEPKSVHAYSCD